MKIKKVSKPAYGLAFWISAVDRYDAVTKSVKPKQDALAKARVNLLIITAFVFICSRLITKPFDLLLTKSLKNSRSWTKR